MLMVYSNESHTTDCRYFLVLRVHFSTFYSMVLKAWLAGTTNVNIRNVWAVVFVFLPQLRSCPGPQQKWLKKIAFVVSLVHQWLTRKISHNLLKYFQLTSRSILLTFQLLTALFWFCAFLSLRHIFLHNYLGCCFGLWFAKSPLPLLAFRDESLISIQHHQRDVVCPIFKTT